jgi:small subunit ribosomal protein S11e
MADFQDQRAYLKQPAIFQNSKKALSALGKKRTGAKVEVVKGAAEVVSKGRDLKIARYVRNVGLGFKTPAAAVSGGYIDKKCPFTGNVSAPFLTRVTFRSSPSRTRLHMLSLAV